MDIAERFALQHAERVAMLESKHMVQQQELTLAEREYDTMSDELRRVVSGMDPRSSTPDSGAARAGRESDAEARLADLKRQMGR